MITLSASIHFMAKSLRSGIRFSLVFPDQDKWMAWRTRSPRLVCEYEFSCTLRLQLNLGDKIISINLDQHLMDMLLSKGGSSTLNEGANH